MEVEGGGNRKGNDRIAPELLKRSLPHYTAHQEVR